jgi:hypothetical protein
VSGIAGTPVTMILFFLLLAGLVVLVATEAGSTDQS